MAVEPGILLTKKAVLEKVTQEQIFERYLGLPVDEGVQYCNPLRIDQKPGAKYYYNGIGTLYFHDFGKFHWDCFAVVQYRYNISFIDSLRLIVKDFHLNGLSPEFHHVREPAIKLREDIRVSIRKWEDSDIKFWGQYNIGAYELMTYKVYPCKSVWMNNEYYRCKSNDPCYCYYFGDNLYKLYFPYRRERGRFFQNINRDDNILQGLAQLPQGGDILIITKSMKDVMCLSSLGYNSVAVHDEYHVINEEMFINLYNRFDMIYTLFDNDLPGKRLSIKYLWKYKTNSLLVPKDLSKDISDLVKSYGVEFVKNLIHAKFNN